MIGIYKFTNPTNFHCYIGQSVNINKRYLSHKSSAYNKNASDYNSQFHQAIRKYGGIEFFEFEILELINPESYSKIKLDELEKKYIKLYNSFKNGYNATEGADSNVPMPGELNGRALLSLEDVKYIRECYNAHIQFRQVYEEYKNKISKRGLQKIWWFDTWKDVYPEYHTEENKYYHSHQAKANISEVAANNKRSFSNELIRQMRKDYDNGMTPKQVWKKYAPEKAWSTVYNAITRQTYKDVI